MSARRGGAKASSIRSPSPPWRRSASTLHGTSRAPSRSSTNEKVSTSISSSPWRRKRITARWSRPAPAASKSNTGRPRTHPPSKAAASNGSMPIARCATSFWRESASVSQGRGRAMNKTQSRYGSCEKACHPLGFRANFGRDFHYGRGQMLESRSANGQRRAVGISRCRDGAAAERHLPRQARERARNHRPHGGPHAQESYPRPCRRQGAGGNDALRPGQRSHHLSLQVISSPDRPNDKSVQL